jgi:hypothetical protein
LDWTDFDADKHATIMLAFIHLNDVEGWIGGIGTLEVIDNFVDWRLRTAKVETRLQAQRIAPRGARKGTMR